MEDVIALVLAVLTVSGGATLAAKWFGAGGADDAKRGRSPWHPALVAGHAAIALVAVAVWIAYTLADDPSRQLAILGGALFVAAALGGVVLFTRWMTVREATPGTTSTDREPLRPDAPAHARLPLPVVAAHGLFAVATIAAVAYTIAVH